MPHAEIADVVDGVLADCDPMADGACGPVSGSRQLLPPARNLRLGFLLGSAALTEASKQTLNIMARRFAEKGGRVSFFIDGHTDRSGSCRLNARLSQARAEATVAYLAAAGVARERMTPRGFGYARPLPGAAPRDGANRRVEIVARRGAAAQAAPPRC